MSIRGHRPGGCGPRPRTRGDASANYAPRYPITVGKCHAKGEHLALLAPDPGAAGSARDGRDPRTRAPARIRARAWVLGARGRSSSRPSGLATLAPGTFPGAACGTRRAFRARAGRGWLAASRVGRAQHDPTGPSSGRPAESWWAGAESNRHSRRRGFYRPLGSPPARPTHDGDLPMPIGGPGGSGRPLSCQTRAWSAGSGPRQGRASPGCSPLSSANVGFRCRTRGTLIRLSCPLRNMPY